MPRIRKLLFAAVCLLCLVLAWKSFWRFEGTEFGSGSLAGNKDLGAFFLILALILLVRYPHSAAASAWGASVLSLPLYLDLAFPRPFRRVWLGEWSTPMPSETFVRDGPSIAAILAFLVLAFICSSSLIRGILARRAKGGVGFVRFLLASGPQEFSWKLAAQRALELCIGLTFLAGALSVSGASAGLIFVVAAVVVAMVVYRKRR